ncbi:MAG: protein adenylyltransferase SelO family protein, partial [Paracoccaceae bacterium]|nr:protein adenylyltransferase SelO family protein [Paracoccaceae bacterium]
MTTLVPFDNSYAKLPDRMHSASLPETPKSPELLAYNEALGAELGISSATPDADLMAVFSGKIVPKGSEPISQAYAGHQFGNFVPSLGDGRAVLLGEVIDQAGHRRDIQLKGSGRTAFSRGGDGKAWLGPVLREYVVSEAMHHMGIPTTRALGAALTGTTIVRAEGGVPGAVLTRVASSHIRVGTFQYFATRRDTEALRALLDYSVARHYPSSSTPLEFLKSVIERQAKLVAKWLGVGFIHGVMNTDNTSISGETIDYGPCAFMDTYHPATVYSSIDRRGRYAYMSQPDIIVWNIAQLASSLLLLESDQETAIEVYTNAVNKMPDLIARERTAVFAAKLGIVDPDDEDTALVEQL